MAGGLMRAMRYPHKFSAMRYLLGQPSLLLTALGRSNDSYFAEAAGRFSGEPLTRAFRPMLPDRFREHLKSIPECDGQGWRLLLYLLVRELRPSVFIETGVSRGASSAFILAAMHENGLGKLYSIDLPPTEASVGAASMHGRRGVRLSDGQFFEAQGIGDLVPEYLRDRWELILGDARTELPLLLQRAGKIDVFFHDSLHTYDHMKFEFEAAWPHLSPGGLLISHDVVWNPAWREFTKRIGVKPFVYYSFSMFRRPKPGA
jgi:predicted O-methyltransferase YrrM